jgi:heme A synthase
MNTVHHHKGFYITTVWTLGLLLLGSIVHATESSLACPDWPTCYGTMVPEMTGGVFWDHIELRPLVLAGAALTFFQSVLGAAVRHMDAGLVCPDVPLCLGQLIPPMQTTTVAVHFGHRATGVLLLVVLVAFAVQALRRLGPSVARTLAVSAGALVVAQVALGFLSVYLRLAVIPVSLHTLLAATILMLTVAVSVMTWAPLGSGSPSGAGTPIGDEAVARAT